MYKAGQKWKPLLRHMVVGVLREQISRMGLNPDNFSPHSFRTGSLQECLLADPSLQMVRLQSDHVSDAINGYLGLPGSRRMGISRQADGTPAASYFPRPGAAAQLVSCGTLALNMEREAWYTDSP